MKTQHALTSAEMGAATIVLIAQMQDCKTEKQAQHHWNRIALLLKTTLTILKKPVPRDAKMVALVKRWQPDGSFMYETLWEHSENGI